MHVKDKPLVHLICGSTGAGKTTYAQSLALELGGIRLSIDEWMVTLYGEDAPRDVNPAWIFPRVERCEKQIWDMAVKLGRTGTPSILDFGFQRFQHREKYRSLSKSEELPAKLHFLDAAPDERWKRVQIRNKQQTDTFQMTITRGMFDYIETIWEPPGIAELNR